MKWRVGGMHLCRAKIMVDYWAFKEATSARHTPGLFPAHAEWTRVEAPKPVPRICLEIRILDSL